MVSGDTIKTFKFVDEETQQAVSVELTLEKGIELKLLEKIKDNLIRIANK